MYTMKVLIVICIFIISLLKKYSAVGPGDPIEIVHDMHPNDKVLMGRNRALDKLLMDNMEIISKEHADLSDVIEKARTLVDKSEDKSMAQYYVDLLKLIVKEGSMSVLNDEQERLLLIMESVGKGAEFQHTLKQMNIIGAFSEAEADFFFKQSPEIGMRDFSNFEVPDLTSTKPKKSSEVKPEEPAGVKIEDFKRSSAVEDTGTAEKSQPGIPEGALDKTLQHEPTDDNEQLKIQKGTSDTDRSTDYKSGVTNEEKLPETPDGEDQKEVKDNIQNDQNKKPETPVGKTHDEM